MKIITAIGNPILNIELNKIKEYEILTKDIQYQEGIIEILEEKSNIDFLILSELIPGELSIYELIEKIKKINNKLKIIIILENKKERLEKFLINNNINNIFYNNEVTIKEIISILKKDEEDIKIEINKKPEIIVGASSARPEKQGKREAKIITILGSHESGKSIFSINFVKNLKNKKTLIIDFDILNSSINSILGVKKSSNKKDNIIEINNNFHLINEKDLLFQNKITNNDIKNLLNILKDKYDYIIIDTSSECFFDATKYLIKNSTQSIFLLEANILEIKKAKKLLDIYLNEWYVKKENLNIVLNKYNKNSISIEILKNVFSDIKILGKINYDYKYNLLINDNFRNYLRFIKIKKEYKNIINKLNIKIFENKIKRIGVINYGSKFNRQQFKSI